MPQLPITATAIKKLITEKCPPATPTEKIYASILAAMAENMETINAQVDELVKAAKFLGNLLSKMQKQPTDEEMSAAATAATTAADEPSAPRDQTPFPTNVKSQTTTAPSTLDEVAANTTAEATPDVGSSGPMNAAPIPKAAAPKGPTPNGTV